MLLFYGITIRNPVDLQRLLPNPTKNTTPSLVDLANHYLGTNLSKNTAEMKRLRTTGWDKFPLSFDKVTYAALDARINLELARKFWQLRVCDSTRDVRGDDKLDVARPWNVNLLRRFYT